MDRTRRSFLAGTTALAAGQLATGWTAEPLAKDGRSAITRPEAEGMVRSGTKGGFTCVRTLESNDGPYYYESSLLRRDLRESRRAGVNLKLGVRVLNTLFAGAPCSPLAGAIVDVWQADAHGTYSNAGTDLQNENTLGQTFLRGHQVTDENGYVEFDTIVPGWEVVVLPARNGAVLRTTHIHVKVFHESKITTTQLYFEDAFLDELYTSVDPYRTHQQMTVPGNAKPFTRLRNAEDPIFTADASAPLKLERLGNGMSAQANIGVVTIGSRGLSTRFR